MRRRPTLTPPSGVPLEVEAIETLTGALSEFVGLIANAIGTVNDFIRVSIALRQQFVEANQAVVAYYGTLRNLYGAMPQTLAAFEEMNNFLGKVGDSLSGVTSATTEAGRAIYDFVGQLARSGDAATVITGGLNMVSQIFNLISRGAQEAQRIFNTLVSTLSSAMDAMVKPIQNFMEAFSNLGRNINEVFKHIINASVSGLDAFSNIFSSRSPFFESLGRLNSGIGNLGRAFGDLSDSIKSLISNIFIFQQLRIEQTLVEINVALSEIQKRLAPILLELTRIQQMLSVVGQVFGFVMQVISALSQLLSQMVGILGQFVGSWLSVIQALAPVQQNLNVIANTVRNVHGEFASGAQIIETYTNSLTLLMRAFIQANISMSAILETVRNFTNQGVLPTTRLLSQMSDAVRVLAERLGILPDEAMRAVSAFATGGDALRQFIPTVTAGALQLSLYQRLGVLGLPAPLMAPFAAGFAAQAVQTVFPAGAAPATLVQFTQSMQTLGQLFQAMMAGATPFGGAALLREIRDLIREFITGNIGRALMEFFRWVSTGIAQALQDVLRGLATFIRSPFFTEVGRGLGNIIRAIGAAVGDIFRNLLPATLAPGDVLNFLNNFAASLYAFLRAGFDYVRELFNALITFLRNMFGSAGILNFITTIVSMFSTGIEIGVNLLLLISTFVRNVQNWMGGIMEVGAKMARSTAIITGLLEIITGIAVVIGGFYTATFSGALGPILGLIGGLGMVIHGFVEFIRAYRHDPQEIMRRWGMENLAQSIGAVESRIKGLSTSLSEASFNMDNLVASLGSFRDAVQQAGATAVSNFERYRSEFFGRLQTAAGNLEESFGRLSRLIRQYVEPAFKGLVDAANLISGITRAFRPIIPEVAPVAPGGIAPALQVGRLLFPFGGLMPAFTALLAGIPMQMQAGMIAQILDMLRRYPPELIAGIPQGEIQRLLKDLQDTIISNVQQIRQAISDEIELTTLRLQYFETTARIQIAFGFNALTAVVERFLRSLQNIGLAAYGLGALQTALEQLVAAYPGIERTAEYQAILNQYLQAAVDVIERILQLWLRLIEVTRRYFTLVGEGFAEFTAWGYNAALVLMGLNTIVSGDIVQGVNMLIESMRRGLMPMGVEMIRGISGVWFALLSQINVETRRAFAQLLTGNVEQFLDSLRQVQQRILQLPEDYLNRIRQVFSIAMRPLSMLMETVSDVRSTLSTIGAEMSLFPYILTRVIPHLIEMRNQFAAAAEEAYRLGDILSFNEALRNIAQLQRQIMELLGVTGMFLPAYTPEQMLRMMMRVGMPTLAEVREAMRGRLMVEPEVFRAVPIPLAQFFGLPAPAAMRVTPAIFGGFPALFAGLPILTPELFRREFRELQMTGLLAMLGGAFDVNEIRRQFLLAFQQGRVAALDFLRGALYPTYGEIQNQIIGALVRQLGAALPPELVRSYLPTIVGVGRGLPAPMEIIAGAYGRGAAAPSPREPVEGLNEAIRALNQAARNIANIFANLSFRLQASPITIEIPLNLEVVDTRANEVINRMSRTLYIKFSPSQPR